MGCRPPALRRGSSLRRGLLSRSHWRADRETRRGPGRCSRRIRRDARTVARRASTGTLPARAAKGRGGMGRARAARPQRARDDGSNCQTAIEPRGGKQKQPRGRNYGAPGFAPGKRIAAVGAGPGGSGSTKRQHCRGCRAGPVSAIRGSTSTGHDLAGTGKRQHHARAAHRVRRPASRPDIAGPVTPPADHRASC